MPWAWAAPLSVHAGWAQRSLAKSPAISQRPPTQNVCAELFRRLQRATCLQTACAELCRAAGDSVLRVAVDSRASPANTYACVCLMMKIKTRAGYTRKSVSPPSHSLSPSLTLFIKSSESFLTESENQVSLGGGPTALPGHSRSCLLSTCRVGCCVRQVSPGCCAVASCFTQGQSKAPSDSEPWQTLRDRCSLPCFSEGSWGGRGLESFQLGDVGGCVQPSGRISSLASTP